MADLTCPNLGTGSVDMSALSKAAAKAKTDDDLAAALETATTRVEAPAESPAPQDAPASAGSAT
jgi:hypothetical protein